MPCLWLWRACSAVPVIGHWLRWPVLRLAHATLLHYEDDEGHRLC